MLCMVRRSTHHHQTRRTRQSIQTCFRRVHSNTTILQKSKRTSLTRWQLCGFAAGFLVLGFGIKSFVSGFLLPSTDEDSSKLGPARALQLFTRQSTAPISDLTSPRYANAEEFAKGLEQMAFIIGKDNVLKNEDLLNSYADFPFATHHPPNPKRQRPSAILKPRSTQEVSQLLEIANEYSIPIVANSGLTSIEGQNIHTRGPYSISISFENMTKILQFHPEDLDIVVQPGVGWQELNSFLSSSPNGSHLMFAPDPGPGANIGGMVGTSCSGTNAFKYGTMKENVINLTVVLADGTIVKTKQRPRKSSAGYDMTHLFIGSEGTLGLVTEITLKLHVKPKLELVAVASFPTLTDAASMASSVIASGIQPNAMEILDEKTVAYVNETTSTIPSKTTKTAITEAGKSSKLVESPTLFFKFGGPTKSIIDTQISIIKQIGQQHNMLDFRKSVNDEENQELWSARRNGFWSTFEYGKKVLPDKTDVQGWGTDIAVPISKLAQVISETNKDLEELGFKDRFAVMGHIGDGNCHTMILYNSPDYHKVHTVVDRMVKRALDLEGTCTGEHGVGVGKRKYLPMEFGESTVDAERKLKLALDPKRILNPDKIFVIDPEDDLDEQLLGHVHPENCMH